MNAIGAGSGEDRQARVDVDRVVHAQVQVQRGDRLEVRVAEVERRALEVLRRSASAKHRRCARRHTYRDEPVVVVALRDDRDVALRGPAARSRLARARRRRSTRTSGAGSARALRAGGQRAASECAGLRRGHTLSVRGRDLRHRAVLEQGRRAAVHGQLDVARGAEARVRRDGDVVRLRAVREYTSTMTPAVLACANLIRASCVRYGCTSICSACGLMRA
jgi:hypothetical protein